MCGKVGIFFQFSSFYWSIIWCSHLLPDTISSYNSQLFSQQESDIKHYIVEKREVFLVPKEEPEAGQAGGEGAGEEEETSPEEEAQSAAVAAVIAGKSNPSLLFSQLFRSC